MQNMKNFLLLFVFLATIISTLGAQEVSEFERYNILSDRFSLEVGLIGGNRYTGSGKFVGVSAQLDGPFALYAEIENYELEDLSFGATRLGVQILIGRPDRLLRPELRAGIEYDAGLVDGTIAGSLAMGKRYGARFTTHFGVLPTGNLLVLFQLGGYLRF